MSIKLLRPLVLMQLKDKLDFENFKNTKTTIIKVVTAVLLFTLICAFNYLMLYMAKLFNIFSLLNIVPVSVITVVFTLMLTLSIFSCTYGLMKSLYFSKDNILLLTLPVSSSMVFVSKLIVFYFYELKKALTYLLPLFLAYGLVSGFTVIYYFWIVFVLIFVSLIPVVLGALLSIPAMFISAFLNKHRILKLSFAILLSVLAMFAILKGISLIPANINIMGSWGSLYWKIQDFLNAFIKIFAPFHIVVQLLVGQYRSFNHALFTTNTLPNLFIMLLFIGIIFGLCMLIVRPIFFKMASKSFEFKKFTFTKSKPNKKTGTFTSALKKEFLLIFRSTDNLVSTFLIFALLPISIFLLNKIYLAMNTNLLGQNLTYSFNLLVILLITLSSNANIATIFSKEGASGYLNKTSPVNVNNIFIAKLVYNFLIITFSLILTGVILTYNTGLGTVNVVLLLFSIWFLYIAHLFWSTELDLMNPQNHYYSTTGTHSNNPNESKSSIFAIILSFIFFGLSILLFNEGITLACIKLICLSVAILLLRLYLYFSKVKVYYKEV